MNFAGCNHRANPTSAILGEYELVGLNDSGQRAFTGTIALTSVDPNYINGQCKIIGERDAAPAILDQNPRCQALLEGKKITVGFAPSLDDGGLLFQGEIGNDQISGIWMFKTIAGTCLLVIFMSAWANPHPNNSKNTVVRASASVNEPVEIATDCGLYLDACGGDIDCCSGYHCDGNFLYCVNDYPNSCNQHLQDNCWDSGGWVDVHCACHYNTPIMVDVLGNGYDLTDANNGVVFLFDPDGTPQQISWTAAGSDDAFLVLDRNGNQGKLSSSLSYPERLTTAENIWSVWACLFRK
jgi:hypothetical protein